MCFLGPEQARKSVKVCDLQAVSATSTTLPAEPAQARKHTLLCLHQLRSFATPWPFSLYASTERQMLLHAPVKGRRQQIKDVIVLLTCGPGRIIICSHKRIRVLPLRWVICKVAQSERVSPLQQRSHASEICSASALLQWHTVACTSSSGPYTKSEYLA